MGSGIDTARRVVRRVGLSAALLAMVLVLAVGQPPLAVQAVLVAGVVVLGLPHGALDHWVARCALEPRMGRWWPLGFLLGYALLGGVVVLGWWAVPGVTLALFLAASWLHFGLGDAEGVGPRPLEAFVRGGVPILLPTLAHPAHVGELFRLIAGDGVGLGDPAHWAPGLGAAWVLATGVLLLGPWGRDAKAPGMAAELAMLALAFILMPPLIAFGLYFCLLHAPRHMIDLATGWDAGAGQAKWGALVLHALPLTLMTLAFVAVAWPFVTVGDTVADLMRVVFCGLAALTLPHMAFTALVQRAAAQTGGALPLAPPDWRDFTLLGRPR